MRRHYRLLLGVALGAALAATACAGSAWKGAVSEDSPAAYYRFLRDHPDSKHAESARARLEFHKLKRNPSLEGLERFRERFPQETELLGRVRPLLEEEAFRAARSEGTAEAYEAFAERFPGGDLAERARGNAVFLREGGFAGRPDSLAGFADSHPESDFAAEARRSAESLSVRERTDFDRVGLEVRIAPGTPGASRLISEYRERAAETYRRAGVELVVSPETDAAAPAARLVIEHRESAVETSVSGDRLSRPGVQVATDVTLRIGDEGPPIWRRTFSVHAGPQESLGEGSVVYGAAGPRYWRDFFVPVARWQSNAAVRAVVDLAKTASAVDASDDRAVVLFEDGDFQVLALEDPTRPTVLAEHERERDLKSWSGVRILGDRVALFGDGLELVAFTAEGTETVAALERGVVGSPVAVERLGEGLVIAGNRGLLVTGPDGSEPRQALRRAVRGLGVVGDTLLFSDGEAVFVSTLPLLRETRVLAQLRLGRSFGPGRLRVFGDRAVVVGETGALVLDVARPAAPRVLAQLHTRQLGPVHDAVRSGDRLFLLGERGLMVLDPEGRRVHESVDVQARSRADAMGRHVVTVGEDRLQVVDATPFRAEAAEAAAGAAAPGAHP